MEPKVHTETSCGAVTFTILEGKTYVLLVKQFPHKDAWSIPKGHVKPDETYEECAVREVTEETGVMVKLLDRLPDTLVPIGNGDKLVVSFMASPIDGVSTPNVNHPECEVAEAMWFPLDELPTIQRSQQGLVKHAVELALTKV